jgi:hypothetical protein
MLGRYHEHRFVLADATFASSFEFHVDECHHKKLPPHNKGINSILIATELAFDACESSSPCFSFFDATSRDCSSGSNFSVTSELRSLRFLRQQQHNRDCSIVILVLGVDTG